MSASRLMDVETANGKTKYYFKMTNINVPIDSQWTAVKAMRYVKNYGHSWNKCSHHFFGIRTNSLLKVCNPCAICRYSPCIDLISMCIGRVGTNKWFTAVTLDLGWSGLFHLAIWWLLLGDGGYWNISNGERRDYCTMMSLWSAVGARFQASTLRVKSWLGTASNSDSMFSSSSK